jgi:hypothetical protein
LKLAADKVITEIASKFTEPEYVGYGYEGQSADLDGPDGFSKRQLDGFSVFMFGKLADEDKLYSDWRLQFISESDRMVRDLLPGGGSTWDKREFDTQGKQMWCVTGPMKIVRVTKGEYGRMVTEILQACCDDLFPSDPDASPTRPGTPFAIIRDFGQNDCMWDSLGSPFRTLHLTKPVSRGTNQDVWRIRDRITIQGKVERKKLEYKHLEGLPCILILVEKGRMGHTFPQSFNCLDLRIIRTFQNTSSFVQEIGRLCRYPGTINEESFSSWESVEDRMFRSSLSFFKGEGGEVDPFDGGRKVLAVCYQESNKFLGYATHKFPWDETERASGTVLFAGDAGDDFIVTRCYYNASSNNTEIELNQAPDAQWGSLVDCRIALKPGSTLTMAMVNAGIQTIEFHDIIEHVEGSPRLKLKGDCSKHFETGKHSITVIRDENCLQWLCEEALRRCRPDLRVFSIEEVAYSFPYTLVTEDVMKKLQSAVNMADKNFPRQIWECIKLQSLDIFVSPEKFNQHAKDLISSKKSLIHDYRKTYLGAKANHGLGGNADAYGADGNYISPKGKGQLRHDNTHPRRFVLSAESQRGKTGAYCWFLKLLADEIYDKVGAKDEADSSAIGTHSQKYST